jgi:hypothetical protein
VITGWVRSSAAAVCSSSSLSEMWTAPEVAILVFAPRHHVEDLTALADQPLHLFEVDHRWHRVSFHSSCMRGGTSSSQKRKNVSWSAPI